MAEPTVDAFEMPTDAEPVRVLEGGCLEILRSMPDGCIDAVITDPPYQSLDVEVACGTTTRLVRRDACDGNMSGSNPRLSMLRNRGSDAGGMPWFDTMSNEAIHEVLAECERVLKPTGAIYVFADVKSGLRLFAGWARNVIVWDKGKIGMGYAWRRMHEWIGYRPMPKHKLRDMSLGDIIRVDGVCDKRHPSEKPVRCIRPLIRNSTDHGHVVLDPFAGSGATGAAALAEGRRAILIEKDPAYADLCRRRIAEAMGKGPGSLFAEVV